MRPSCTVPALTLAATATATDRRGGAVARAEAPPLAETHPTGFAAVDTLGRNGTTGRTGGATMTATTEQFLECIDMVGPLVIRVPEHPPAVSVPCSTSARNVPRSQSASVGQVRDTAAMGGIVAPFAAAHGLLPV